MNQRSRCAEIAVAHCARLVLYARQWLSAAGAQDVVQDSLIALLSCRSCPDEPLAWMYTVVRRRAIDASRSQARRRRHEGEAARDRVAWFAGHGASSLDAEAAQKALEELPRELREIVILRIWGGLGFVQIAQIAQVSVGTAHQRFNEALKQLRSVLEQMDSLWKTRTQ